jgi:hypothetical protein
MGRKGKGDKGKREIGTRGRRDRGKRGKEGKEKERERRKVELEIKRRAWQIMKYRKKKRRLEWRKIALGTQIKKAKTMKKKE